MTRVLVCADRIGAADPVAATWALAAAFADAAPGRVQVAAVPMAASGPDLASALAALGDPVRLLTAVDAYTLGVRLGAALAADDGTRLLVDLTDLAELPPLSCFDLLAGLAGAAPDATMELSDVPLTAARLDLWVALPEQQAAARLLGVEGVAARWGYERGWPVAEVVGQDARLAALASRLSLSDAPGLGAAGGLPLVLAALGGRRGTGFELCAEASGLARTIEVADLLMVGVDTVTIGDFGGPVLVGLAALASERGTPCAALARAAEISVRELRRHGVQSVHQLSGGPELTASEIERRAAPVASAWLR